MVESFNRPTFSGDALSARGCNFPGGISGSFCRLFAGCAVPPGG
ncbi:Uncharacterized protein pbN1_08730 [Aromatoleum bremense]|nr:Uncharacterized protein pbN1_08730 [Aromatoleum bremense]